ncbi:hypothetical protein RRG08_038081 [Elysia crispata]|uniref:Uncharacterized protein n=1 Tax=Elysia crispata TaxID=231223 RepID=A0AAE0ZY38_9GAST|nr:hypothetical protein RRG08_038081 [Elysia crispata]
MRHKECDPKNWRPLEDSKLRGIIFRSLIKISFVIIVTIQPLKVAAAQERCSRGRGQSSRAGHGVEVDEQKGQRYRKPELNSICANIASFCSNSKQVDHTHAPPLLSTWRALKKRALNKKSSSPLSFNLWRLDSSWEHPVPTAAAPVSQFLCGGSASRSAHWPVETRRPELIDMQDDRCPQPVCA